MQHENRGVGCGEIEFLNRRHAAFGELKLGPATDYTYPLRVRCAISLRLQHAQCIDDGRYAFPTQFQVVVQAAADQMEVRVIEARHDRTTTEIDDLGIGLLMAHDGFGVADFDEFAIADGDGGSDGILTINGVKLAVDENEIWCGSCGHDGLLTVRWHGPGSGVFRRL